MKYLESSSEQEQWNLLAERQREKDIAADAFRALWSRFDGAEQLYIMDKAIDAASAADEWSFGWRADLARAVDTARSYYACDARLTAIETLMRKNSPYPSVRDKAWREVDLHISDLASSIGIDRLHDTLYGLSLGQVKSAPDQALSVVFRTGAQTHHGLLEDLRELVKLDPYDPANVSSLNARGAAMLERLDATRGPSQMAEESDLYIRVIRQAQAVIDLARGPR